MSPRPVTTFGPRSTRRSCRSAGRGCRRRWSRSCRHGRRPRAAKSTGYCRPCSRAASCTVSGMPASTASVRSTGSKPSTRFMRSGLTTSSPLAATARRTDRCARPKAPAPRGARWRPAHDACLPPTDRLGDRQRRWRRPTPGLAIAAGAQCSGPRARSAGMAVGPGDAQGVEAGIGHPPFSKRICPSRFAPWHSCQNRRDEEDLYPEVRHPRAAARRHQPQRASKTFRAAGYSRIELLPQALPGRAKLPIADAHIVGIPRARNSAPACWRRATPLAVGCFCIGTNQVDLEAAELQGVPVFNAPSPTPAAWPNWCWPGGDAARDPAPRLCHRGGWSKSAAGSHGRAARRSASSATATSAPGRPARRGPRHAGALPRHRNQARAGNARPPPTSTTCSRAATSSPCTCRNPATRGWSARELARMKPAHSSTPRAAAWSKSSHGRGLRRSRLGGAAVDVFPAEPRATTGVRIAAARARQRHPDPVGGSTLEAQDNIGVEVAASWCATATTAARCRR